MKVFLSFIVALVFFARGTVQEKPHGRHIQGSPGEPGPSWHSAYVYTNKLHLREKEGLKTKEEGGVNFGNLEKEMLSMETVDTISKPATSSLMMTNISIGQNITQHSTTNATPTTPSQKSVNRSPFKEFLHYIMPRVF